MRYRSEVEIELEFLNFHYVVDQEIFKELATKIINEMPLDELKKLFKFNKKESTHIATNMSKDSIVVFIAEIDIPE